MLLFISAGSKLRREGEQEEEIGGEGESGQRTGRQGRGAGERKKATYKKKVIKGMEGTARK